MRRRRGLTLLEVVVALVIMGILAAVMYPTIGSQLRGGHAAALAKHLENVRDAIVAYRDDVTQYPMRLAQLTTSPTTGALDLCGTALSAGERNDWRGPYMTSVITGDVPVGNATAKDTILRSPPTTAGTPVGLLRLRLINVDSGHAADLEARFDGNGNYAAGTILWTATGPSIGTLTFQMPIRGC